jgi:glycosyltransferase 2 family protein
MFVQYAQPGKFLFSSCASDFISSNNLNLQISSTLRRAIQILGIVITLLALTFAFQRVWSIGRSNWEKLISVQVLLIIILGGVAHGVNQLLMGWAWQKLLIWFGEFTARLRICLAVYGRTQIAKYLPGNLFHYPARHVLGNRAGFHHPALVGALVYEIIGQLVAAGIIALVGLPKGIFLGNTIFIRLALLPLVFLLPLVIQFILTRFSIGRRLGFPEKTARDAFKGLLPIWAIYLVFFLIDGVIFGGVVGVSTGDWSAVPLLYIISAFAISWVIGFLTPGSPAGLGVREAIMILILTPYVGSPAAAFVALVSRLVVTLGDVVFFLSSYFFARKLDL